MHLAHATLAAMACTLLISSAAFAQTESEPNNDPTTANTLVDNVPISGSICNVEAPDFFSVQTTVNGRLDVDLTASHASSQLNVTIQVVLQNASGEDIGSYTATSGTSGIGQANPHSFTCLAAGQYYIEIAGANAECNGYYLTATLTPTTFPEDAEDNDDAASALTLGEDTWTTGTVNYSNYDDDMDWYRIDLPDDGLLTIPFQAMKQEAGTYLGQAVLYDADQNVLNNYDYSISGLFNPADTAFTTFTRSCLGAGTYYFRISSSNTCGTSYRFKWMLTHPVFANDIEDNDSPAEAQATSEDAWTGGHVNFDTYSDNEDYFRMDVPVDGFLTMDFEAIRQQGGTLYGNAQLLDDAGNEVANWPYILLGSQGAATDTASTTATQECLAAGTYFLRFTTPNSCGTIYRFKWDMTPAPEQNDPEDNDILANAAQLLPGTLMSGHINFDTYDDNSDWFRFHVYGSATPTAVISASHQTGGEYFPSFDLTDADGTVLLSPSYTLRPSSDPLVQTRDLGTLTEGDYYLHMVSPVCGTSYSFTVNGIGTVGVHEQAATPTFGLLPNPSPDGMFTLRLPAIGTWDLAVLDGNGRVLLRRSLEAQQTEIALDLSRIASGTYTLSLVGPAGQAGHLQAIIIH